MTCLFLCFSVGELESHLDSKARRELKSHHGLPGAQHRLWHTVGTQYCQLDGWLCILSAYYWPDIVLRASRGLSHLIHDVFAVQWGRGLANLSASLWLDPKSDNDLESSISLVHFLPKQTHCSKAPRKINNQTLCYLTTSIPSLCNILVCVLHDCMTRWIDRGMFVSL